jgi:hypothetical protein
VPAKLLKQLCTINACKSCSFFCLNIFQIKKKSERMGGRGKGRGGGGGKGRGGGGGKGGGSKVGFIKPADPSFLRRLKEQYGYKASHFTVVLALQFLYGDP